MHRHSWRGHAQSRYSFSSGLSTAALFSPRANQFPMHTAEMERERERMDDHIHFGRAVSCVGVRVLFLFFFLRLWYRLQQPEWVGCVTRVDAPCHPGSSCIYSRGFSSSYRIPSTTTRATPRQTENTFQSDSQDITQKGRKCRGQLITPSHDRYDPKD